MSTTLDTTQNRHEFAACVVLGEARSVPRLRRFVRGVARHWGLPAGAVEAAAVVVTELAANAVQHSGSPDVTVLLALDDDVVCVEVRDRGQWRRTPPRRMVDTGCGSSGGRGLALVGAYSTGCMVWCEPDGTRVTTKVPLSPRGE